MTTQKISDLTSKALLEDADLFLITDTSDNTSKKTTLSSIRPQKAVGSIFVSGNEVETSIADSEVYYPVAIASTGNELFRFTQENGVLTYTSSRVEKFFVSLNCCITGPAENVDIRIRVSLNGVTLPRACGQASVLGSEPSGRKSNVTAQTVIELSDGDTVGFSIGNWTSTDNVLIDNYSLTVFEI